jgi:uncharacterized membrane protein
MLLEVSMTAFYIFIFRAILGGIFAVLLTRFFYPKASIVGMIAIAIFLVGMAYVMETFHKRKRKAARKD